MSEPKKQVGLRDLSKLGLDPKETDHYLDCKCDKYQKAFKIMLPHIKKKSVLREIENILK